MAWRRSAGAAASKIAAAVAGSSAIGDAVVALAQECGGRRELVDPCGDALGVRTLGGRVVADVELDAGAAGAADPLRDRRASGRVRIVERDVAVEDVDAQRVIEDPGCLGGFGGGQVPLPELDPVESGGGDRVEPGGERDERRRRGAVGGIGRRVGPASGLDRDGAQQDRRPHAPNGRDLGRHADSSCSPPPRTSHHRHVGGAAAVHRDEHSVDWAAFEAHVARTHRGRPDPGGQHGHRLRPAARRRDADVGCSS